RGTISIGRRLQDPLSELVKIEPQHIGVGMYQHDIAEKRLRESLDVVVESCVNNVGVDLNRSSVELLKYVSGLNRTSAKNIVKWRNENGSFRSREQLKKVAGIGEVTFTQAAGFLRISDGDEPFDATWIHPESYPFAKSLLKEFGGDQSMLSKGKLSTELMTKLSATTPQEIATQLQVDHFTAEDLIQSLLRPGRDPRQEIGGPLFRSGVLKFEDLKVGLRMQGAVTNVVDFGAFVDIGLKNDGLVHISKMSDTFVSSPFDHVNVGDVVTVWVDNLDEERKRVGLSLLPIID
ncbi:helix-hairpin-helix domain-containing protein, partial [bacterium]|nr:helix-hairpin-helix domain-containing protein [bacterium]